MSPPNDAGPREWLHWLRTTDDEPVAIVRDVLSTAGWVVAIGLLLFAVSGVWPPMVAVESPSMEPHMSRTDLVFVMEEHRLAGDAARDGTGVVTYAAGERAGYEKFGSYGDVIIFRPDGESDRTPIIHRAHFWVEEGENWYDEANPEYVGGADDCGELAYCPAPHAGFITKGDNNGAYDQVGALALTGPVKPQWVVGTAEFRIPWLGWLRLQFAESPVDRPAPVRRSPAAGGPADGAVANLSAPA
ncbi:S26 family signal peptidase [Halomicrococcus sp. SG-WS-1]|uniref:S26 family signal peptidase n=1 Tax=Halomicrococcus sp. SG-WS-1 TaxID=3439057 RepID=UPI003F7A829E